MPEVVYILLPIDYVHDSQSSLCILYCFFLSAMPPKDIAPFSYTYPTKNPLLMIKYEISTSCRWCFLS